MESLDSMTARCATIAPLLILVLATPFWTGLLLAPREARAEWKIDEALMPEGLFLEVNHRSRYEFLNDQFRRTRTGDTDVFAFRTLVHGGGTLPLDLPIGIKLGAELQDSRAEQNSDTLLNTTIVNATELLRAYVELDRKQLFGGDLVVRGGRITMDVGSRRLVARNRYRNTINGFTGIDAEWKSGEELGNLHLRGFWTLPVFREPNRRKRLLDNDIVFDSESLDVQFWGLYAARDLGDLIGRGELYVLWIRESDAPDRPTLNRRLVTPGFRLYRKSAPGQVDYTVETAVQFGKSRAITTAGQPLDHLAHFHHLTVGYTFDAPWVPRIALQYDYASGDENPNDGSNERFQTLFGARRFDFGPTGIYGPFARANLHTPGLRVQVKPKQRIYSFVAYSGYWLASDQDAWTTTGVRDLTGSSGSFIGSQLEIRVRIKLLPGNLTLESGYAHLFAGEFIDDAPNSNRQGDSDYVYTQLTLAL
jgi:hypothetical protein